MRSFVSTAPAIEIRTDEGFEHLPSAPIVEAVIEILAEADAEWEEARVAAALEAALPGYATTGSYRAFQHDLQLTPGESHQTFRDLGWRGLRFQSSDQGHVVQFNRDGYIFSRLRPYQDWEQLSREGLRLWKLHAELARPSEIQRLGLRYINRIVLQSKVDRFGDYLRPCAQAPEGLNLPFHGFFHHDVLEVPGYPYAINVIRTIQPSEEADTEGQAVILDIDVYTTKPLDLHDETLRNRLGEMRWLKNKVFFGSVTENAIERFRGSPR
jgi:uncharacterized protein (TIGR04255 family)